LGRKRLNWSEHRFDEVWTQLRELREQDRAKLKFKVMVLPEPDRFACFNVADGDLGHYDRDAWREFVNATEVLRNRFRNQGAGPRARIADRQENFGFVREVRPIVADRARDARPVDRLLRGV